MRMRRQHKKPYLSVGQFIIEMLVAAITLSKINPYALPTNYSFPSIFLLIISLIVTVMFQDPKISPEFAATFQIIFFVGRFIGYFLLCFLFSIIGAVILDIEHSSKIFAINTSSFLYVPFISLLHQFSIPPQYIIVPELLATFFMTNNLVTNLLPYYSGKETFKRIFHVFFLFTSCFMLTKSIGASLINIIIQ